MCMPCDSTSLRDPLSSQGIPLKCIPFFRVFLLILSVFFTRETPGFPRFPKNFRHYRILSYILYAITHMYILTKTHMYILTKKNGNLGNLAYF